MPNQTALVLVMPDGYQHAPTGAIPALTATAGGVMQAAASRLEGAA